MSRISLGFVLRAHGVRGTLRIRSDSEAWPTLAEVVVGERVYRLAHVQRERGDWLVTLEGVGDRDAAEALRGAPVAAERAALPALPDDELYVADLIGCQVVDQGGRVLGTVSGSFFGGAQELLEVAGERPFLLPLIEPIVVAVDLEGRRVVCDPPPGLIEGDEAAEPDEGTP